MTESHDFTSLEKKFKLWKEYSGLMAPLSPVIFLLMFGEYFVWLEKLNQQMLLYFLAVGVVGTVIWLLFDLLRSKADFMIYMGLHGRLDPIDRDAQTEIFEGLQGMRLINERADNDTEKLMRRAVNEIAILALIPAAYHNHHANEMLNIGIEAYFRRKKRDILRAFNFSRNSYKQLIISMLPADTSFEYLVERYVEVWVRGSIVPATRKACALKVQYYDHLLSV